MKETIQACAIVFGCTVREIKSLSRAENVVYARQAAAILLENSEALAFELGLTPRSLKYNAEKARRNNTLFAAKVREVQKMLLGKKTSTPEERVIQLAKVVASDKGLQVRNILGNMRGDSARARALVALALYQEGQSYAVISSLLGRASPSSAFTLCDEAEELIKIPEYAFIFKQLKAL